MKPFDLYLDNSSSAGLGDNLCLLSALANTPNKINLYTTNEHNTFDRLSALTNLLQIPTTSLEILPGSENGNFHNTGWPLKLLTDYYRPKFVQVNNQLLENKFDIEKKCVALVGFYDSPQGLDQQHGAEKNHWPWCKRRPVEYWTKIFAWIKSMNLDVITLDRFWSLDNKVEALIKNCCAVISYEGGIAHLAHVLSIPCFVIDWKHPSPSTRFDTFHVDLVHKAHTVYIVRDDNELFEWDYSQFRNKIEQLSKGMTNNRILNKEYSLRFKKLTMTSDFQITNRRYDTFEHTRFFSEGDEAAKFLDSNYTMLNNIYLNI